MTKATNSVGTSLRMLLVSAYCLVPFLCGVVTSETYTVQTRIVVDYQAWEKWSRRHNGLTREDLKKELRSMFVEISDIYENIDATNLTYKFEITDIEIISEYDPVLQANQDRTVYGNAVVPSFTKWLKKHSNTKNYDIAVLFTGFVLYHEFGNGLKGIANVGHVCQQDGVTGLEFSGNRIETLTAAHEIGHILGINHDGYVDHLNGDATDCKSDSGYLMNPYIGVKSRNNFYFSECSVKLLREKIKKLNSESKNCLTDSVPENAVKGLRTGTKLSPDAICKKHFGFKSFLVRKQHPGFGDDLCLRIACLNNRRRIKYVLTPQGLKCGKSKQCIKGKCVVTTRGDPSMSDSCPYGDQPWTGSVGTSCPDAVRKQKGCKGLEWACCATCKGNTN